MSASKPPAGERIPTSNQPAGRVDLTRSGNGENAGQGWSPQAIGLGLLGLVLGVLALIFVLQGVHQTVPF
jgi:hypothetical protein